jgi:hypothetical protein
MNTCTRRFILRLAVGLLAFLIGVSAAWALGGFNPFQRTSSERYYKYKSYRNYRNGDLSPEPDVIYPLYHKGECDGRRALGKLPPSPPPAPHVDTPVPPKPPSLR